MTIQELYRKTIRDIPALDTRIILEHVLGLDSTSFITHSYQELNSQQIKECREKINLRKQGMPVAYIVGQRDFYGHTFMVEEGLLIPQPDTETLVEEAVKTLEEQKKDCIRILDICSGTGCVGISLALEARSFCKNVELTLSDVSEKALEVFSKNAELLLKDTDIKLCTCLSDMFDNLKDKTFDIIVSNPPYIMTSVIKDLPSDVQREPHLALDGGEDGLKFMRILASQAKKHLEKDCAILVEIGYDQGRTASEIFAINNWHNIKVIKDLGQRDRVVKCTN